MDISFIPIFSSVCVFFTAFDFYYSWKAFHQYEKIGRSLGLSSAAAGIIILAYLYSISTQDYLRVSISSSIYFLMIDWMLVFLLHFVYVFTDMHIGRSSTVIRAVTSSYAVFDSIVLIVNIFREIAVHYVERETVIAHYSYQMKPLYILHLAFTYSLVVLTLIILIRKCVLTPQQYRNQYMWIIAAILLVVAVNAIFLYPEEPSRSYTLVDYSILGYSLGIFLMYWAAFSYRKNNMLKILSMTIFENIGQGIVLFDYSDRLIMHNRKADRLLPGVNFEEEISSEELVDFCQIPEELHEKTEYSVQCHLPGNFSQPVQCSFRRLKDRQNRTIGNLFVLSDTANENDPLTGFQHWQNFRRFAVENPYHFHHPTAVVVFDINGLGHINRTHGREVGDQRIRNLVQVMRRSFPADTHFIRGFEAHLLAVCSNHTEADMMEHIDAVLNTCGDSVVYGMSATTSRSAFNEVLHTAPEQGKTPSTVFLPENYDILQTIETASRALQVKKLLSAKSTHSQTVSSLVRALQESDTDTEAHVQRTQRMGAVLGQRVGLCDAQLADLKLLCLLHDIGKIGIPLEILNKPGKLTDAEWSVLRSHAEKGYQIAMSSDELRDIARMILYHHERWDGKGYPERLPGQNIPLLSRIIAIVDAYDAMVNNRSYRKGFTPEQAQAEIRRNAGTQFDPYLAEQFLQMLEENPDIALGESTGGEEVRSFIHTALDEGESGNTYPVACSRYLLDLDDTIIEIDGVFEEITGFSRTSVVGRMSQYDLIPEEDRAYYMLQVNNQFTRGSFAYLRHNILCRNGEIIQVICYGKRYFDSVDKAFRSEILIFPVRDILPDTPEITEISEISEIPVQNIVSVL